MIVFSNVKEQSVQTVSNPCDISTTNPKRKEEQPSDLSLTPEISPNYSVFDIDIDVTDVTDDDDDDVVVVGDDAIDGR